MTVFFFSIPKLLLGYPFLAAYPWSYVSRAFEFTRQFQFKWTVNWRFIGEETFLSRPFSLSLLALHISLLTVFLLGRWMQPSSTGGRAISIPTLFKRLIHPPPKDVQASIARQVTPDFILTSVLSAVVIGCLCARSLHYQFYVYIVWATPFLLWRSGMHMVGVVAVFFAQEWAWNVYPSTDLSSSVVVACLAITVASSWIGIRFPTVGGSGSRKNVKSKR
jgi:alpha-1,3-mannosyltransferase